MKLTPESLAVVVKRAHSAVIEQLAEHIDGETGGTMTDPQYDALSVAVEEKLTEAIAGLEFDGP